MYRSIKQWSIKFPSFLEGQNVKRVTLSWPFRSVSPSWCGLLISKGFIRISLLCLHYTFRPHFLDREPKWVIVYYICCMECLCYDVARSFEEFASYDSLSYSIRAKFVYFRFSIFITSFRAVYFSLYFFICNIVDIYSPVTLFLVTAWQHRQASALYLVFMDFIPIIFWFNIGAVSTHHSATVCLIASTFMGIINFALLQRQRQWSSQRQGH